MNILIYSKSHCTYCEKAKALLTIKGLNFTENKIGDDITREDFISLFPEQKTVPLIFINDERIGGYDNLVKWFDTARPA